VCGELLISPESAIRHTQVRAATQQILGDRAAFAGAIEEFKIEVLRTGGLLSITELAGDPDAMTERDITALAKAAKLEHAETFPMRFGFTINFRKAG